MYHGLVHYDGPHANQYIVVQGTAVNDGIMPDRNVIANGGAAFFECAMNTSAVLHIDLMTHTNKIYIAPYDRIEPNTARIAHRYIAHDGGIGSKKTSGAPLRMFTPYRKDGRHAFIKFICKVA
jgi:hypothetical protein